MAIKWDEVTITDDNGHKQKAKAPIIISASRATDIPAFFTRWLINRISKGYATWHNPFNLAPPMYVSFEKARIFVFWTKNPLPLLDRLDELDKRNINYYFQYTLNDYANERLEPGLPALSKRVETFKRLSDRIGKKKLIWRFDPLVVMPGQTPRDLLTKIWNLGNRIKGYTDKLVFSFVDVKSYKKVQNNLIKELTHFDRESVDSAEPTDAQVKEIAEGLFKIQNAWKGEGWDVELATCAEEYDLEEYNIMKNKCIDDDLMARLFPEDKKLMHFIKYGTAKRIPKNESSQLDLFGNPGQKNKCIIKKLKNMKDSGQRKACGCIYSKDIGMYNTCRHFCVYCYANSSRASVERNKARHSPLSESIIQLP